MAGTDGWTLVAARDFAGMREAWQRAADRNRASIAVGADFVEMLIESFGRGDEIVAIHGGIDGPDSAAVLQCGRRGVWTTFQPTEACIGLWIQPADADLCATASRLMRKLPGVPVALGVLQQDPLYASRPGDSARLRTMDHYLTASIGLQGDFDTYWASRGKNLRNNMKKARAELRKLGIAPALDIVTTSSEVRSALDDYAKLEAAGWKGKSGTAVTPDNPEGRFYRRLLERACEKGAGEIHRYSFGDHAVAMDLCLRDGETLIVLKTAYDEAHARVSPASLMREEQIRRLFAEGRTRRVEFYGPVMEWHTRWTQDTRMLFHVNCYRFPFVAWLHGLSQQRRRPASSSDTAVPG